MLAGLGKSEDRLEFLQAKNEEEHDEDDEMVVVCHNVLLQNSIISNRIRKNELI